MATTTPKRMLKQSELQQILTLRLEVETVKRALKRAEEELTKAETLTLYAIEQGQVVERGELSAAIKSQPGRRVPKWKEEFAQVAGPAAVEKVIDRTEPGPESKKLVVMRGGQVVDAA